MAGIMEGLQQWFQGLKPEEQTSVDQEAEQMKAEGKSEEEIFDYYSQKSDPDNYATEVARVKEQGLPTRQKVGGAMDIIGATMKELGGQRNQIAPAAERQQAIKQKPLEALEAEQKRIKEYLKTKKAQRKEEKLDTRYEEGVAKDAKQYGDAQEKIVRDETRRKEQDRLNADWKQRDLEWKQADGEWKRKMALDNLVLKRAAADQKRVKEASDATRKSKELNDMEKERFKMHTKGKKDIDQLRNSDRALEKMEDLITGTTPEERAVFEDANPGQKMGIKAEGITTGIITGSSPVVSLRRLLGNTAIGTFDNLRKETTMAGLSAFPGAISEGEREYSQQSQPAPDKTPEENLEIIRRKRIAAQKAMVYYDEVQRYIAENGTIKGFFELTPDAEVGVVEERVLPDGRVIQLLDDGTKRVKP